MPEAPPMFHLRWMAAGQVRALRELKSKTDGKTWRRIAECATGGETVEIAVPEDIFGSLKQGQEFVAEGYFRQFSGKWEFHADSIGAPPVKKAGA